MTKSAEFKIWSGMLARCTNANDAGYPNYGGRGITVCERWLESFENFYADMGLRPAGRSIDRVDNDKGYSPENCRWATPTEQALNRRKRRMTPISRCKRGHKFTPENTYRRPDGFRACRACLRDRAKRWRAQLNELAGVSGVAT